MSTLGYWTLFFAIIGLFVSCIILYQIVTDAIRAVRQGIRVAYVCVHIPGMRRKPSWKLIRQSIKRELFDLPYDDLTIGLFIVPYNPNKPIRGDRRWWR